MRTIQEIINENKTNNVKLIPIHLFKHTGFKQECYDKIISALEKEWPAALQDCHEDEYMVWTGNSKTNNELYNDFITALYYSKQYKSIDGMSTRGIGSNFYGWSQFKSNNKSVFIIRQGKFENNDFNQRSTDMAVIGDKSFFEQFNII